MSGLFLLSIASPFLYQTGREYYDGLTSRPPLLQDFQLQQNYQDKQKKFPKNNIEDDLMIEDDFKNRKNINGTGNATDKEDWEAEFGEEEEESSLTRKGGMTRSDSEYSLGLSRSISLNDIGHTNYNALGICTTGRITYEILKYCGTAAVIMGIFWQVSESTKSQKK